MIEIQIQQEQIDKAKKLYDFGCLNGSITKGKSNIYGALGEVLIFDFFKDKGLDVDFTSTYDYDLIIESYKIDVKTKRTTVKPKDFYLCSISNWNTRQKCDFYFFVRILENLKTGYLLGFKSKSDFFKESTFNKKGSPDINGWTFKDDGYNLKISSLYKFNRYET